MTPRNPNDRESNPSGQGFGPAALVRTEAEALQALAARLDGPMAEPFARAAEMILHCGEVHGRVVVTGMGKSGIIAQKIAATLSSTGSPALFLHPAEAACHFFLPRSLARLLPCSLASLPNVFRTIEP